MAIIMDDDRWFVSFSTDYKKKLSGIPPERTAIGLDVGLTNFATISDGSKIANPRFYQHGYRRIRILERRLSRKKRNSMNRKKAKHHLQKVHQHVQDSRMNFLHQVSTYLVRKHNLIAIENLKISNMLQNHHLASSISDTGWRKFKDYLTYKAESAGCQVVLVDPKNTSQTCSNCNTVRDSKLNLSQRTFDCHSCDYTEDRDINAAKNILARATAGRAGSQACEEVSSTMDEIMIPKQDVSMKQELYGDRKEPSISNSMSSGISTGEDVSRLWNLKEHTNN